MAARAGSGWGRPRMSTKPTTTMAGASMTLPQPAAVAAPSRRPRPAMPLSPAYTAKPTRAPPATRASPPASPGWLRKYSDTVAPRRWVGEGPDPPRLPPLDPCGRRRGWPPPARRLHAPRDPREARDLGRDLLLVVVTATTTVTSATVPPDDRRGPAQTSMTTGTIMGRRRVRSFTKRPR